MKTERTRAVAGERVRVAPGARIYDVHTGATAEQAVRFALKGRIRKEIVALVVGVSLSHDERVRPHCYLVRKKDFSFAGIEMAKCRLAARGDA